LWEARTLLEGVPIPEAVQSQLFRKLLQLNSRTRIRAIIRTLGKANWRRSLDESSTLRWRLYLR
jgi:hypothetical protein